MAWLSGQHLQCPPPPGSLQQQSIHQQPETKQAMGQAQGVDREPGQEQKQMGWDPASPNLAFEVLLSAQDHCWMAPCPGLWTQLLR